MSSHDDAERRRSFACPAQTGDVQGIDLAVLDPNDRDDRRFLILADHPELHDAIRNDAQEIRVDGQAVNPKLHIALHEVVANQLWDDNPKEVWPTAQRLRTMGYERHDVLHMLASVVSDLIWGALREQRTFNPERYDAALNELPNSWQAVPGAARPSHRKSRLRSTDAQERRRRHR